MEETTMANALRNPDSRDELELNAYNAAFYELGLRWHWDQATYERLQARLPDPKERLSSYLSDHHPHLLRAYDIDFLSAAIEEKKSRVLESSAASSAPSRHFDWAHSRGAELGA
jgi:hypothetical protein